jgi:3-oxoadipate enol-lactonase
MYSHLLLLNKIPSEAVPMKDNSLKPSPLKRDGCPIHYWLKGHEKRPLVTLIHGAASDHHIFDPQIASVAQYFHVLLWDMRGHGQSQPLSTPFSIHGAAEDLIALLDHLGYAKTALVGISLGGTIAQEVVSRFPERVTVIVIAGIPCNTIMPTPMTHFMLWAFMQIIRNAPIETIRRFLRHFAAVKEEGRAYVYQAFSQVSEHNLRQIMEAFNDVFQHPSVISNYRITHPLLLIHGQNDNYGNLWLMPVWAKRDSHCRYVVIPKAGHLANWDEAHYFNRVLIDFLREQELQQDSRIYEPQKEGLVNG